jgi:hypothetical protein
VLVFSESEDILEYVFLEMRVAGTCVAGRILEMRQPD